MVLPVALGGLAPVVAEEPLPNVERLQSSPVLRHLRPNPASADAAGPAAPTLRQMHVPEGFRVDVVAAEPDVRQPIAMAIDERGRIWIAEAYSYPTRRAEGEGLDQLVILADTDHDGRFESRKVFARGLNLVSGFEVGFGGVWVGAAPHLLFIPDRDGDDTPDAAAQVLLDGFGFQDTHECLNSFHWGPDGWLYGIQGVFNFARIGKPGAPDAERQELRAGVWRYHPTRHEFEVFAHGGSNPWGLDHDEHGQLFMTHCRSYWGGGCTTHVLQGGHFWNQANANYASFIVAEPPAGHPQFRNYLLASARYDHGAGGAGKPGSDAIYGGHSHVGTMIYLGDNWPEEYRGRLFTHNLHGHQINQQVNLRLGSGFDTVHAGRDQFFCSDPLYVAVDLQYGPDGAVYVIDWYDQQHCHNPNTERWDRGNGRVYRMAHAATYRPVRVNLAAESDAQLIARLEHRNAWYGRTARRLLQERAAVRRIDAEAIAALRTKLADGTTPALRLGALWMLQAASAIAEADLARARRDPDEFVRSWAIRLATDRRSSGATLGSDWTRLAETDPSPVVRLHLASAMQRVGPETAWAIAERLALHAGDVADRNIPFLLWHGLAPHVGSSVERALQLADRTAWPQLADWIHWYAATGDGRALDLAVAAVAKAGGEELVRRLTGLALAREPRASVPPVPSWTANAPRWLQSEDPRVRRLAERLAPAFGDTSVLPALRRQLADRARDVETRRHAFEVLARTGDAANVPVFLALLDEPAFRARVLPVLGRYDAPEIAALLVERFTAFDGRERAAALQTLTSRPAFANVLLDAVSTNSFPRTNLTAFHVRQLTQLRNPEIDRRVAETWGRLQNTPAEKLQLMETMEKTFNEAPLWAYDGRAGREHFRNLCASCHVLGQDGTRVGPELTGAGRNGIRYYLENIIDPNAVVGADFETSSLELKSGDVVSGLVIQETDTAVSVRTTTETRVVPKNEVAERTRSGLSLMPEGLLEGLGAREQIELLKYLIEH